MISMLGSSLEDEKVEKVTENELLKMHHLSVTDGNRVGGRNPPPPMSDRVKFMSRFILRLLLVSHYLF